MAWLSALAVQLSFQLGRVVRCRIHGQGAEKEVIRLRDRAADQVLEPLSRLELLEIQSCQSFCLWFLPGRRRGLHPLPRILQVLCHRLITVGDPYTTRRYFEPRRRAPIVAGYVPVR